MKSVITIEIFTPDSRHDEPYRDPGGFYLHGLLCRTADGDTTWATIGEPELLETVGYAIREAFPNAEAIA